MTPLRTRRIEMGLTVTELAARAGISIGQLSRIENGRPTSQKTAIVLYRLTGVKVAPLASASTRDVNAIARVIGGAAA